jgi:hypothetical protein
MFAETLLVTQKGFLFAADGATQFHVQGPCHALQLCTAPPSDPMTVTGQYWERIKTNPTPLNSPGIREVGSILAAKEENNAVFPDVLP